MDKENSGTVSLENILKCLNELNFWITEKQLADTFKELIHDQNDLASTFINYTEFMTGILNLKVLLNSERLWTLY